MVIMEVNGKRPSVHPSCFIADNAYIVGDVRIKANSSVWFNTVLRGDTSSIEIGENSNIQDGTIIKPDRVSTVIGDQVSIGKRVVMEGVYIENEVVVGMGAILLENSRVGTRSVIGAGSLVSSNTNVQPSSLIMGVPGRLVGAVDPKHVKIIEQSWRTCNTNKDLYKRASVL